MNNIPKRLPAKMMDRAIDTGAILGNPMIQLELEFPKQLDAERLSKALDLTIDAEPILGFRWVAKWLRPYWERVEERRRDILLLTSEKTEYEKFMTRSMDLSTGPQIEGCLWRSSDKERLLLKVSHYVADAAGVKDIAAITSSIYSRLANNPSYRPEPNLHGSRSIWQVIRHVPWYIYPKLCLEVMRKDRVQSAMNPQTLPLEDGPRTPLVFIHRFVPADRIARLSDYRKVHNATINDLMMAALLRALVVVGNWDGQKQLTLNTTVDLRRYIPGQRAKAVTNLSTGIACYPNLGTDLGKDFASTLALISTITRERKANWLGVADLIGWFRLLVLSPHGPAIGIYGNSLKRFVKSHGIPTSFTNLGLISEDSVIFEKTPLNARVLPPPAYPPLFGAGISGYARCLTISAGVYPSQKQIAERLFDRVLSELPK